MLEHLSPRPAPPARVVVLGAGGFVGSAIVRRLAADGIARLPLTRKDCDLLAPDAAGHLKGLVQPNDSVVFVSAIAPARTVGDLVQNVRMGQAVCDAFAADPPAHLLYISSDAVYSDDANPVTESSSCQPSTLHGMMHAARELMLRLAVKAPIAILRPTLLYGAGDPHNGYGPNRFRRQAARGEPIKLFGEGEERRDYVFIDDVATLVTQALVHRSRGVLNIATGVSTSFRQVAEMVGAVATQTVKIEGSPRQTPVTHRHFDVTACLKAFPKFRSTPLGEGVRRAAEET